MNEFDFSFDETPWELTLAGLRRGDKLSAVRFLTLMEGEDEQAVEDALLDLEDLHVALDISDLPKAAYTGEAAVRLRREEQLANQEQFWTALKENDPLRLYLEELAAIPVCGDAAILAAECAAGKQSAQEQLQQVQKLLVEIREQNQKLHQLCYLDKPLQRQQVFTVWLLH